MADHVPITVYYRYFAKFGLRPSDVDALSVEECELLMMSDEEAA